MFVLLEMNKYDRFKAADDVFRVYKEEIFLYWLRNSTQISTKIHDNIDGIIKSIAQTRGKDVSGISTIQFYSGDTFSFTELVDFLDSDDITAKWSVSVPWKEQYNSYKIYAEDILRIKNIRELHTELLNTSKVQYDWYWDRHDIHHNAPNTQTHRIISDIIISRTFQLDHYHTIK